MEALVIPFLILVFVAISVMLVSQVIARRSGRSKPQPTAQGPAQRPAQGAEQPIELARAAAGKLTEDEHRKLYALIAQGQAMAAIKLYYEASGEGLRASRNAVGALATHPQPYHSPPMGAQDQDPDDAPQRFPYRYRAIASKGEITREVSSNMLNDEIFGRIRTLARSGDPEAAANALTRHSDISMTQAREFIALLDE